MTANNHSFIPEVEVCRHAMLYLIVAAGMPCCILLYVVSCGQSGAAMSQPVRVVPFPWHDAMDTVLKIGRG